MTALAIGLAVASAAAAEPADAPDPSDGMVALNFPEDLDLKVLIDYVGKRLSVNFIYDEQIGGRKVTIKAPTKIPAASLMTLLESALKMKGLAVVPTEVPGMMRVEVTKQLSAISVGPKAAAELPMDARPTLAVTRVFELKHASPQRVETVVKPFLSSTSANLSALADHDMVVVTDYAGNMQRIEEMVTLVDRPGREVLIRFVTVQHVEAERVAPKVTSLLQGRAKARGEAKGQAVEVVVEGDARTNQVIIVGEADNVEQAVALVEAFDVPLGLETRLYPFTVASPEQVDLLVREIVGEVAADRLYKSAIDPDANLLIVTATPEIHEQIETLRRQLDKPLTEAQSPIRFYKLENAKAVEVMETLRNIAGSGGLQSVSVDGVSAEAPAPRTPRGEAISEGPTGDLVNRGPRARIRDDDGEPSGAANEALDFQGARIMADESSNMIIVVAEPSVHPVFEKLIERLDVRRPQVLVKATVVTLDTTDDFSLGVELHGSGRADDGTLLTFTQFGLTTTDEDTGALTLVPGIGFNGALLGADTADAVIRALQTDSRARVVARPSVLVNDNATATLVSESEEPFSSINAFTSGTTTESFGGYSAAGTNIVITPQISEGDHLKLEYEITLSSFGEGGAGTLPPSRQTNSLASEATFPDGYTIVVGGLTRENFTETINRVPLLGSIPGLEYLFSFRSKTTNKTTLFVFIRAVILRDDKFRDLKVISREAGYRADLEEDFPTSEPVTIQ
jgi:type II secretion system protein D